MPRNWQFAAGERRLAEMIALRALMREEYPELDVWFDAREAVPLSAAKINALGTRLQPKKR